MCFSPTNSRSKSIKFENKNASSHKTIYVNGARSSRSVHVPSKLTKIIFPQIHDPNFTRLLSSKAPPLGNLLPRANPTYSHHIGTDRFLVSQRTESQKMQAKSAASIRGAAANNPTKQDTCRSSCLETHSDKPHRRCFSTPTVL